jgi:hypothetical protein
MAALGGLASGVTCRSAHLAEVAMNESDESVRTDLPRYSLSLARAAAPWKRSASATTTLPDAETLVTGWVPDRGLLAEYRTLMGSWADLPIAFPQVPVMALHIDLLSRWSFPIRAMGMVHQGTVIEVLDELPADGPWDVRAWISGSRHVRSGLEFDLCGEVSSGGRVCWRSTAVTLSRSRSASGAEESQVPVIDSQGPWEALEVLQVDEGTGRAFGRVTGDVNPIHMHAVPARLFGFRRAIVHGWWTTGRTAAVLGVDQTVPGRRSEISFRRPVELPSTPVLCSRAAASGGVEFALFPVSPDGAAEDEVRALVAGVVLG